MKKTYSGKYHVKHPEKYKGDAKKVFYRSMWERDCFVWLDEHARDIEWWNSEEFFVRYYYEVDKKYHRYFIDLAIKWKDKGVTLVEVKPKRQTKPPRVKTPKTKQQLTEAFTWVRNQSKWEAANEFAKDNGWKFVIWTEDDLKNMGILKTEPGKLNKLPGMRPYRKKRQRR